MICRFYKSCFITVITVYLVLASARATDAGNGFHAQSRNLPATSNSGSRDCFDVVDAGNLPAVAYAPDPNLRSADIEPVDSEDYPVIRFDLGLANRRKGRYISPGLKNNRLRARDMSVGEVSVDTFNGTVALDGQPETRSKNRTGC